MELADPLAEEIHGVQSLADGRSFDLEKSTVDRMWWWNTVEGVIY